MGRGRGAPIIDEISTDILRTRLTRGRDSASTVRRYTRDNSDFFGSNRDCGSNETLNYSQHYSSFRGRGRNYANMNRQNFWSHTTFREKVYDAHSTGTGNCDLRSDSIERFGRQPPELVHKFSDRSSFKRYRKIPPPPSSSELWAIEKRGRTPLLPGYQERNLEWTKPYIPKSPSHFYGSSLCDENIDDIQKVELEVANKNEDDFLSQARSLGCQIADSKNNWIVPNNNLTQNQLKFSDSVYSFQTPIDSVGSNCFYSSTNSDLSNRGDFSSIPNNFGSYRSECEGAESPVMSFDEVDHTVSTDSAFRAQMKSDLYGHDNSSRSPSPVRVFTTGNSTLSDPSVITSKLKEHPIEHRSPEEILDDCFSNEEELDAPLSFNQVLSSDASSSKNDIGSNKIVNQKSVDNQSSLQQDFTSSLLSNRKTPSTKICKIGHLRFAASPSISSVKKSEEIPKSVSIVAKPITSVCEDKIRSTRTRRIVTRSGALSHNVRASKSDGVHDVNADVTTDSFLNEIYQHLSRIACVNNIVEDPSFTRKLTNPFVMDPQKFVQYQISTLTKYQQHISSAISAIAQCKTALENKLKTFQIWQLQFIEVIRALKSLQLSEEELD